MKTDGVSGGPITPALIRGRSLRVRWLRSRRNRFLIKSPLRPDRSCSNLDFSIVGCVGPIGSQMPLAQPILYSVLREMAS
jgi:hypothetical protein